MPEYRSIGNYGIPSDLVRDLPRSIDLPSRTLSSANCWLTHTFHPGLDNNFIPIGVLYYFFWMEQFTKQYAGSHLHLIIDEPHAHGGFSTAEISAKRTEKQGALERIVVAFNLDQAQIAGWETFKEYSEDYQRYQTALKGFFDTHEEFKTEMMKYVPCLINKKFQNSVWVYSEGTPYDYQYFVDLFAALLTMTQNGHYLRFGPLKEKSIDGFLARVVNHKDFTLEEMPKPGIIYLAGDYRLNAKDVNDVLPVAFEHSDKRRIVLTDTDKDVREKLKDASDLYISWIRSILRLRSALPRAEPNLESTPRDRLAEIVFTQLLRPIQELN